MDVNINGAMVELGTNSYVPTLQVGVSAFTSDLTSVVSEIIRNWRLENSHSRHLVDMTDGMSTELKELTKIYTLKQVLQELRFN